VIARPRPEPDDTPAPELTTPMRVAAKLLAIATQASRLRIRARGLALYLHPERSLGPDHHDCLASLAQELALAGDLATDLASAIRVGQVLLDERYLDPSCRPGRPLLDAIEHAPLRRAADGIAPAVAARGDTDPAYTEALARSYATEFDPADSEPLRLPVEHPQAEPARQAARRRKARAAKGGAL
jgi:hypothetical protein